MPAPFAALEARVNDAVQRRLANAMAVFGVGAQFPVVFDRQPEGFEQMVESMGPWAAFSLAHAPGLTVGSILTVEGVDYQVASGVTPDASGWVTVQLQKD